MATPLMIAAGCYPKGVWMLLAAGADPTLKNHNKRAAQEIAEAIGHPQVAAMLAKVRSFSDGVPADGTLVSISTSDPSWGRLPGGPVFVQSLSGCFFLFSVWCCGVERSG